MATFVSYKSDGGIHWHVNSVAEARMAIKELQAKKREYQLAKRLLGTEAQALRIEYTNWIRHHGKTVGMGKIGRFVRGVQSLEHQRKQRHLADQLSPIQNKQAKCLSWVNAIDQCMLQVRSYIDKVKA